MRIITVWGMLAERPTVQIDRTVKPSTWKSRSFFKVTDASLHRLRQATNRFLERNRGDAVMRPWLGSQGTWGWVLEDYEGEREMETKVTPTVTDKTPEVSDLHRQRAEEILDILFGCYYRPCPKTVRRIAEKLAEWEEAELEWLRENEVGKEE